jgi:hypothetical protein
VPIFISSDELNEVVAAVDRLPTTENRDENTNSCVTIEDAAFSVDTDKVELTVR